MTNVSSDYEFIFTAADARRQQRSYSVLSWSQIFNPSSYYSRNNINRENTINLSNTNSIRQQSNNNSQPPSYEEAIQQSLNPSTVNIAPLARPTVIHHPLDQVIIPDESQPLLSDPEILEDSNYLERSNNNITTTDNNNNDIIKNRFDDSNPDDEIQELGGPSSSGSNLPISNERSIPGVHYGNDGIPPPPEYSLSDAIYERDINGVTSHDPKLNSEPESLLRFFMEHNDKPEMAIKVHGYHTEVVDESYTSTDSDGNRTVHYQSRTVEITDFNFTLDLTEHISTNGIIRTISKNNKQKDILELLNEYVKNENTLKNIEMKKVVIWDYESLTKAISTVIRQQGYRSDLRITFPLRNHFVRVESDHKFAKFARNIWTKILCFITCLWIIFFPILWLYRNSFKNQIRSDFVMNISEKDWFDRNVNSIVTNVRWL
ncbi:hypothetical protein RhiirA5_448939 [Rhizophagus irregularis]|uniref:Abc transporter n=4 Tax=Rhizophagus irregularis TaxID=588596 RepID=A0A2I1DYG3_9GLOM|nr:hypothetical protein GLOIN_2v1483903 [Rhizophagus irregularis DAOM 181602=DAOM 197198]EXX72841.1 hypothetical protein RirG_065560 [Rhizophagus irregularis DAOM 197198w]PKC15136.1 hypothetical protein RhiirA5_448939 [Rhizophagus irregularis]PKK77919.1 hypothetical protein RhiirC2_22554 [Rhizophagus irregularis]PKY14915.1 hypothetical protein RhiirB3_509739 [Rhizophagus irregularis]PKY44928.1 hypothetical protein RhiirA4_419438 [Rhizophagus irregularis]|eukprot:XP_025171352.1 hypothetical protein GLOIN_2v1483903 [Rhizophagus irregularis DAOM 181602=DAOM 197198]